MRITLVLGGARSGKSAFAQGFAERIKGNLLYIATAQAFDSEMSARIARHKSDRSSRWQTLECPVDLAGVLCAIKSPGQIILIECLTLWLSNLMLGKRNIAEAVSCLTDALHNSPSAIILVSNEVGQGIVPDNALARSFRDEMGWINQTIANMADEVWFVTAGLPQRLKGMGEKSLGSLI